LNDRSNHALLVGSNLLLIKVVDLRLVFLYSMRSDSVHI